MQLAIEEYRQKLHVLVDELPATEISEIYHFTMFRYAQKGKVEPREEVPSVPAEHLRSLVGLIAIGGDALHDAEALYE
jgi:hypothetical protein